MQTQSEAKGQPVLLVFATLMVGVVLSMIAAVSVSAQRSSAAAIDELWQDSASQLLARVVLHVETIYEPGTRVVKYAESAVQSGRLDPSDQTALYDHLESVIDAFPTIVWASYGTETGSYVSVYRWPIEDEWEIRRTRRDPDAHAAAPGTRYHEQRRGSDGLWTTIRDERSDVYDPRKKPWFVSGKGGVKGDGYWSDPILFHSRKQLGLMRSMGSYHPESGEFQGVWAAEFEAGPVVEYLSSIQTTPGTRVYIVDENGTLVSRPDGALVAKDSLLTTKTAGDPLLAEAWTAVESGTASGTVFEVGDTLAMYQRLSEHSTLPWYVIVTIPKERLFAESKEESQFAIFIGILGVLFALLLTFGAASALKNIIQDRVATAIAHMKVGQYTLEAKLGSGGMGDVYQASHAMLRRPTAIKLLQAGMTSPVDIKRFEREVQTTCKLSHPNTITIFDYGQTPDGRFYYAMELIDGVTMLELVHFVGPLSAGRTIFLVTQICAALAEAHGFGLIHRDIKPSNILIAELGGRGDFIKIVDFGLVKHIESGGEDLTREGAFAGTPGFLAPEVPTSQGIESAVADIYSLGAVMYVMITGHMPYEGDSAMGVFINQQTTDPEPPSTRPGLVVPHDIELIIMRCLSRDPLARPQTMDALKEELLACADAARWSEAQANAWWAEYGDDVKASRDRKKSLPEVTTMLAAGIHKTMTKS